MATITQTVEETLTFTARPPQKLKQRSPSLSPLQPAPEPLKVSSYQKQKPGPQLCPPGCVDCQRMTSQVSQLQLCPPDCEECQRSQPARCPPNCLTCKKESFKAVPLLFNAIGIIIAILATYLIVTTDSQLYLVFWIFYSVIRRLMTKSKSHVKSE